VISDTDLICDLLNTAEECTECGITSSVRTSLGVKFDFICEGGSVVTPSVRTSLETTWNVDCPVTACSCPSVAALRAYTETCEQ